MTGTRTYISWTAMKQRCLNKKNKYWEYYGGRGITICPEWMDFINFFRDMGIRPENKTLDRKDNNLGYCKSNCRYATRKEQQNNRRPYKFNSKTNFKMKIIKEFFANQALDNL